MNCIVKQLVNRFYSVELIPANQATIWSRRIYTVYHTEHCSVWSYQFYRDYYYYYYYYYYGADEDLDEDSGWRFLNLDF